MSKVSIYQNFIIIACRIVSGFPEKCTMNKKSVLKGIPYILIGAIALFVSCSGGGTGIAIRETPTSGDIKILVDESFRPLIDAEIRTFTSLYQNARITPLYKPEVDVVNEFMKDSAKVMVTSRKLTDDQIKYLRDTLIVARTTTFAYDALALVVNNENADTLLRYEEVRDIFEGKVTDWQQINRKSSLGPIRVIFDNPKSGNIRFFREKFDIRGPLPASFFAVNSNEEVINFVEKNRDALGIISINWISDKDDSLSVNFLKRIRVAAVSLPFLGEDAYYRPKQGNIYDKSYPFIREIYLISRETFTGLGSGFINWACAEQGQRIVLKSGLLPATMPIRLVQIKQ
jgi:phosphate transport system substrate-binding protein